MDELILRVQGLIKEAEELGEKEHLLEEYRCRLEGQIFFLESLSDDIRQTNQRLKEKT